MVDSTTRSEYRGTVEFSIRGQRTRRQAGGSSRAADVPEALTKESRRGDPRQKVGGDTASRQVSVATAPAADQSVGWSIFSKKDTVVPPAAPPTARAANTAAAVQAEPRTRAEADALVVQSLKDALSAAGVNFEGLGLAAHEDVVRYPGGSYVNRYISVTTNGAMEGLMTDLVAINPKVAVLDIQRMLQAVG